MFFLLFPPATSYRTIATELVAEFLSNTCSYVSIYIRFFQALCFNAALNLLLLFQKYSKFDSCSPLMGLCGLSIIDFVFDVLLTVHLSIILIINQLNAQILVL